MSLIQGLAALLFEGARAMHYAGNLLRERAKAERYDAKRIRRRAKEQRKKDRDDARKAPEPAAPKVPGTVELNSPEFFERMAEKMAAATDIGGVNVADIPIGPPADPGPIGP